MRGAREREKQRRRRLARFERRRIGVRAFAAVVIAVGSFAYANECARDNLNNRRAPIVELFIVVFATDREQ